MTAARRGGRGAPVVVALLYATRAARPPIFSTDIHRESD
ncbi:hypothetical protein BURMUCF1_A0571 [Burkholderia multivorans ATCC BAA-247]|uniref:Uncharacterized protein n=1 Tax=Burkholderia multivorans CGD2 TaxID=513052 RepID=B9BHB3_9BURK|nr:hypothetical protein BURMUCGD2_4506 [Burkholderia multivorans CGD2]EEE15053.1 hypothetical protein BURMUCGD2M_4495 [Burkholderia multivorans CGD2M]EJO56777.1 hypothetical protein BURMUCF1_A0571 [Burkholderia multivorans ATCC BAA-247]